MSKRALISLIGRNKKWIKMGIIYIQPEVVILIADKAVDELNIEKKTYYDYAIEIKKDLTEFYKDIPKKPIIKIVELENSKDLREYVTVLRTVINRLKEKGYQIYINITAGPLERQLYSYYIALNMKRNVQIFYYDKQTNEQKMLILESLTETEQIILDIIAQGMKKTSEILKEYTSKIKKNVKTAFISKYLKLLRDKGFISKNGSYKLTEFGEILANKDIVRRKTLTTLGDL